MDAITNGLLENSKSAILGCIELHNKPSFSYRYEVCTILAINSWELMLKAYINEHCKNIKLIRKDDTSIPFESCISNVSSSIGKEFRQTEENLKILYKYRCQIIHFYKDNIDPIIYSLLHTSVLLYNDFSKKYFNIDLSETSNLILMPIGFNPIISPIDYLSNTSNIEKSSIFVRNFVKDIITSTKALLNEEIPYSILSTFNVAVINENRTKNADIIAGITKDENSSELNISNILTAKITDNIEAKEVRVTEDSLFKTKFVLSYSDVTKKCKEIIPEIKLNAKFNQIMEKIKEDPNLHKARYLDPINKTGTPRYFYSNEIFDEIANYYK